MNLCQRCKKECKHDLEKCTYYSPAKMTNFERIKQMTIEELADFLDKITYCCKYDSECGYCPLYNACIGTTSSKTWLESEDE